MLIYLAALAQNKDLHPAGILYMPAFIASVTSDGTESAEKLKLEVEKNLRMNGLLLKDNEVDVYKRQGFDDPDALLTAPETRSSSPVRILRNETRECPTVRGLFPCGEGAGYAGGITSAAVDGLRCAEEILKQSL